MNHLSYSSATESVQSNWINWKATKIFSATAATDSVLGVILFSSAILWPQNFNIYTASVSNEWHYPTYENGQFLPQWSSKITGKKSAFSILRQWIRFEKEVQTQFFFFSNLFSICLVLFLQCHRCRSHCMRLQCTHSFCFAWKTHSVRICFSILSGRTIKNVEDCKNCNQTKWYSRATVKVKLFYDWP